MLVNAATFAQLVQPLVLVNTFLQIFEHLRLHVLQVINLPTHVVNLAGHLIYTRSLLLICHHLLQLLVEKLSLFQLRFLLTNQLGLLKILSNVFVTLAVILNLQRLPHFFVSSSIFFKLDHTFVGSF